MLRNGEAAAADEGDNGCDAAGDGLGECKCGAPMGAAAGAAR